MAVLSPSYSAAERVLGERLGGFAASLALDVVGIAGAEAFAEHFPSKPQPAELLDEARSVIVIGLERTRGAVDTAVHPELSNLARRADEDVTNQGHPIPGTERFFMAEENALLNRELQIAAYTIARWLERHGHQALTIPGTQDQRWRTAVFYHLPAAYLAGLGTLGWNCSLITPRFGPRVNFNSIITSARLPAGRPLDQPVCDHCGACVEACPVQALNRGWKDVYKCAAYGCCGTCQSVCPVGR